MTRQPARTNGGRRNEPKCDCGGRMRLFGIEAHPTVDRKELRTYVCRQCDQVRAETMLLPPLKAARTPRSSSGSLKA